MPTVLDEMTLPQDERIRRDQQRKAQARADLFRLAGQTNGQHGTLTREIAERNAQNMQEAEDERRRAEAAAAEQRFKDEIRRVYLESGGDATSFEVDWPALRAEIVRRKTLTAGADVDPKATEPTGVDRALRGMYPR